MTDLFPPNLSERPAATPMHAPQVTCRYCGSTPATDAVFQQQTGMVIMRQMRAYPGPFCRNCGLSVFRAAMSHTLGVGWLGLISLLLFPITVIQNLLARRKVGKLAAPVPPAGSTVMPALPGRPVFLRPLSYLILLPVLLLGLGAWMSANDTPENQVGKCITVLADDNVDFVSCSQRHDGVIISVVDRDASCPASAIAEVERMSGDLNRDGGKKLCVGEG